MPTKQERLLEIALEAIAKLKGRVDSISTLTKGDKGDTGERGPQGEPGKDGRDGKDGKDGRDGINGKNGLDGVDGLDGADGRDGKNGKDGADGKDGRDGLNGANGKDGSDGVGIAAIEQPNPDTAKVVLTDGREYDLNLPRGRDGKDGQTITINKRGGSGSNTDAPQTAVGGFVPTLIKTNETFTIPENTQALFMKRIKLQDGARLKAFGVLVQPR